MNSMSLNRLTNLRVDNRYVSGAGLGSVSTSQEQSKCYFYTKKYKNKSMAGGARCAQPGLPPTATNNNALRNSCCSYNNRHKIETYLRRIREINNLMNANNASSEQQQEQKNGSIYCPLTSGGAAGTNPNLPVCPSNCVRFKRTMINLSPNTKCESSVCTNTCGSSCDGGPFDGSVDGDTGESKSQWGDCCYVGGTSANKCTWSNIGGGGGGGGQGPGYTLNKKIIDSLNNASSCQVLVIKKQDGAVALGFFHSVFTLKITYKPMGNSGGKYNNPVNSSEEILWWGFCFLEMVLANYSQPDSFIDFWLPSNPKPPHLPLSTLLCGPLTAGGENNDPNICGYVILDGQHDMIGTTKKTTNEEHFNGRLPLYTFNDDELSKLYGACGILTQLNNFIVTMRQNYRSQYLMIGIKGGKDSIFGKNKILAEPYTCESSTGLVVSKFIELAKKAEFKIGEGEKDVHTKPATSLIRKILGMQELEMQEPLLPPLSATLKSIYSVENAFISFGHDHTEGTGVPWNKLTQILQKDASTYYMNLSTEIKFAMAAKDRRDIKDIITYILKIIHTLKDGIWWIGYPPLSECLSIEPYYYKFTNISLIEIAFKTYLDDFKRHSDYQPLYNPTLLNIVETIVGPVVSESC